MSSLHFILILSVIFVEKQLFFLFISFQFEWCWVEFLDKTFGLLKWLFRAGGSSAFAINKFFVCRQSSMCLSFKLPFKFFRQSNIWKVRTINCLQNHFLTVSICFPKFSLSKFYFFNIFKNSISSRLFLNPKPLPKNSNQASVSKTTSNCFLFVLIKKLASSFFFLISWIP